MKYKYVHWARLHWHDWLSLLSHSSYQGPTGRCPCKHAKESPLCWNPLGSHKKRREKRNASMKIPKNHTR